MLIFVCFMFLFSIKSTHFKGIFKYLKKYELLTFISNKFNFASILQIFVFNQDSSYFLSIDSFIYYLNVNSC